MTNKEDMSAEEFVKATDKTMREIEALRRAPAKKAAAKKAPAKKAAVKKAPAKTEVQKMKEEIANLPKIEEPKPSEYYSLNKILKKDCTYNVIFGERSNGKTYALLTHILENFVKTGKQFAYVRRWQEDVTGARASNLFTALVADGSVYEITDKAYKGVHYYAGKFYLCNYDEKNNNKPIYSDLDIIGYPFAISGGEHYKSNSFPNITTIVFDEFLTRQVYLPDEFVHFMNVVSTIVRQRTDVKIYMLGNTVNKFCPYFEEMGLVNILTMKQGSIDVYQYGNSELKVAVEYCAPSTVKNAKTNKYFAFNNPRLEMITGGAWELAMYPHLPEKYTPGQVVLTFFIEFNNQVLQCEVVDAKDKSFIFIHRKTTPIQKPDEDLIYSHVPHAGMNYCRNLTKPQLKVHHKILWYFEAKRVYYQSNDVGEVVRNFVNYRTTV